MSIRLKNLLKWFAKQSTVLTGRPVLHTRRQTSTNVLVERLRSFHIFEGCEAVELFVRDHSDGAVRDFVSLFTLVKWVFSDGAPGMYNYMIGPESTWVCVLREKNILTTIRDKSE